MVRYASSSSGGNNPDDWNVGSNSGDAHKEAAENWEKIQVTTNEYFKFITNMAFIVNKPEVERLSTYSQDLAKEAENCPDGSDRDIIKNERDTISNQSNLISEAERALESGGRYNRVYQDLKPSMNRLRDSRNEALKEREEYEALWNEELDYEEEQRQKELQQESKQKETESKQNLENQKDEGESSKGKRKLEVDPEEQGEYSKRRESESTMREQGEFSRGESPLDYVLSLPVQHNPLDGTSVPFNPQGESSKGKEPEYSNIEEQGEYSKGKEPESSTQGESSKKESPLDYVLSLPQEYNPFDDVGDD